MLDACSRGSNSAYVSRGAQESARKDLNLKTMTEILAFIATGGLESETFQKTSLFENWDTKNDGPAPMADVYSFYSGKDFYGYIAFFKSPKTDQWIIKSLKRNEHSDPRYLTSTGPKERISGGTS